MRISTLRFAIAAAIAILAACTGGTAATAPPPSPPLRYVAIGDSYTIGTSVTDAERWPHQLLASLAGDVDLELVANLGVNGATSADVLARQVPAAVELDPDFVTVLVGVNDVVQRTPAPWYAENLVAILDALLAVLPPGRIVVVSTPDYTRTPAGGAFGDRAQQSAAIDEVNQIARTESAARGIAYVDIGEVADRAGGEPDLVARDGLHPSGQQYREWVERIAPVVRGILDR